MSKIRAVRIVNLNYNHDTIRVDDALWYLNGDSTLLSLRNGGGKSVLVQMMTAPFVHKKYRNSKERPFASYFTSSKPTFVLVEWQLDDQAGYVLTGMMVRQHQADSDTEENSVELDMINFVHAYTAPNEYDISHFPVITQGEHGRKLKSYTACVALFNGWKNDRQLQFFAYDMNNSTQQRAYFSKLEEYRIYHREWEEIVCKINQRESGLSELFADCKDERKLVERWFLPKVEAKLDKRENRMKEFQHLTAQYVQQYAENQDKVAKRAVIHQFYDAIKPVQATAEQFQQQVMQGDRLSNRLAWLQHDLSAVQQQAEQTLQTVQDELRQLAADIQLVQYDQRSWQIYQLEEEQQRQQATYDHLVARGAQQTAELAQLQRQIDRLECAQRYQRVREASEDVQIEENRLELLAQDVQSLQPEREQIGYTLQCRYSADLEEQQQIQQATSEQLQQIDKTRAALQQTQKQKRQQQKQAVGERGRLEERLRQYDQQEQAFQQQYQIKLARNLMGDYEPGLLEQLLREQTQTLDRLRQQITAAAKQKEEQRQKRHAVSRQENDGQKKIGALAAQLSMQEQQMEKLQTELAERRVLAEHIHFPQDALLDTDAMTAAFQARLEELQEALRLLRNQEEQAQQQYRRLEEGRLLELPANLAEALHSAGIDYLLGMDWLRQNGNSETVNQALVEANPFIPYSLVMRRQELQRLAQEPLGVACDFPIPIVSREALQQEAGDGLAPLFLQERVGFYVLFDQRLLHRDALAQLLAERQRRIDALHAQLKQRQEEYTFYRGMADQLKQQQLSQSLYLDTQTAIEQLQTQKTTLEETVGKLRTEIAQMDVSIESLEKAIRQQERAQQVQTQQQQALEALAQAYQQNRAAWRQLQKLQNQLSDLEQDLQDSEIQLRSLEQAQQSLLDGKRERQNTIQGLQKQLRQFLQYQACPLLERDTEDLLSRYQAITQQLPQQQQEIERQLQKAKERYEKAEEELLHYSDKCGLVQDDYAATTYDRFLADEVEAKKMRQERLLQINEEERQACQIELGRLQERMEHQLTRLKEQLGYAMPRPKEEILVVDFDRALAEKQYQQKALQEQATAVQVRIQLYQSNLDALAEFISLPLGACLDDAPKLTEMQRKALNDYRGKLVRDYRANRERQRDAKDHLQQLTDELRQQPCYQDDFFARPLQTLLTLTATPEHYLAQLQVTTASYQKMLEKLAVDIALLDQEQEKLEETFYDYLAEVHRQIGSIDRGSTIRVRARALKMLRITLPNWAENEALYRARLRQYLEDVTAQCLRQLAENQPVEELLASRITTQMLYDTVVGVSHIKIQLYKIEAQQEYPIHWANVAANSGGEGFLSAFIVLSSLLSFMRSQESDLFRDREEGKVLLMDNPFAQTNAAHLLVPMMEIAKRVNMQLICLSGLGGDSIYSRFDNIYVLTLVASGLNRGLEYLRSEHVKGAQHMVSAQIQTEDVEQLDLF